MPDVVLPVLDEAGSLPWVLQRMPAGYRPIVVDNGSTDGSADVARAHGATVVRELRRGFGHACKAGLDAADDEVVCFLDADGSLDPSDLPLVAEPVLRGEAQLVLGARSPAPGAWPLHARIGNRVLARRLGHTSSLTLRDIGPMRAIGRADLLTLDVQDRRFGWPLEMVMLAGRAGFVVQEVDVPYGRRRAGSSKVTGSVKGTLRTVRDMSEVLRTCT